MAYRLNFTFLKILTNPWFCNNDAGQFVKIYDLPIHSMNISVHLQHFIHIFPYRHTTDNVPITNSESTI